VSSTESAPERTGGAAPWGPALLLVVVAWAFVPQRHLPDFDSFKTLVLLGGVALLTLVATARGRATPSRDRDLLLIVPWVLAFVALGVTFTAGPRGSLEGPLLALGCLGAARLVAAVPDGRAAVLALARGASIAALGAGSYALLQVAGLDPAPWGSRAEPVATFGNTSFAAEFQAAALPLALWLACFSGRPKLERALGGAAALLAMVHLGLATSRIDLIAATAGLVVLAYRVLDAKGRRGASRAIAVTAACGGLAAAWLFLQAADGAGPGFLGRSDTVAVRAHIWSAFREMALGLPLYLPQGAPFVDLYPAYRPVDEFLLSLGRDVTSPHNDLMALAVPLGLAGLVIALACASRLWRRATAPGPHEGAERAALAACIAALLVSGLASSPLSHGGTALLGALAWGAVIALRPASRAAVVEPRVVHAVAAVLLVALFLPALRTFRSDAFLAEGRQALAAGRADDALKVLDIAAAADPRAHEPRFELGTILHNAGESERAVAALRAAHAVRPGSPATRAGLARALLADGRREEGRELLDASVARFPWHPELLTARAQLALAEDRGAEALADLVAARDLLSHEPRMEVLVAEARLAAEPGFPAHEQALDALKALLAADDRAQVARSVPALIRRDPTFLASLVAMSRRIVREQPEHAAILIASAVESPVARSDPGFLQEGGAVLTRAGWTEAGSRFTGRALGLQARDALARGENETALRLVKKAAPRDPDPEHWLVMARALVRLEQRRAAVDAIGSAIATGRVDPDAVRADPDLGRLLPNERLELLLQRAGERLGESP
jgi:tetratricopeptide (TPR) repeat protein